MPFTFSHIAAVLPLLRNRKIRWSTTGLVLCSITPDFEKFLRLSAHNDHSHSWASLFYFSCPMALGLAFLFHGVVRNPLIAHLPRALRQRLARFQRFNQARYFRRHYGRVLVSVLLGAVSHLGWDSFTHRGGEMVTRWPFLQAHWHIGPLWFPTFVAVNLLSSVVGIALVLAAVWQLPLGSVPQPPAGAQRRYWRVVVLVVLVLLAGRLLLATVPLNDIDIIISVLSGAMVGVASVRYRLVAASSGVLS